jgi:sugar phosphate isomerase/epimerase
MKLSISNIAWEPNEDKDAFELIKKYGFEGIELAPPKLFKDLSNVSDSEINDYLEYMKPYNFKFPAMQSLLFGKPELKIFDGSRNDTLEYLKKIIDLAQKLDVKVLVFGSPKNRFIGDMPKDEAYKVAIDFFKELGEYAYSKERYFCIEPNAKEYGCDFITNTDEAIELVKDVNSKGFRLHIDSAVMVMNSENVKESLEKALPYTEHFHISEPFLELITENKTNHKEFVKILKTLNYDKWVSVEMKNGVMDSNVEAVKNSLKFVKELVNV